MMADSFEYFLNGLFAGEGWAVAVAFVAGIFLIWLVNRAVELYRHVQQWFQPIQAPAPQPMQETPSGCARFGACVWAGMWLLLIVFGLVIGLAWLVAGDAIWRGLSGVF